MVHVPWPGPGAVEVKKVKNSLLLKYGFHPDWPIDEKFNTITGQQKKKMGAIPPKLGPYGGNKNLSKDVENRHSARKACFQEF